MPTSGGGSASGGVPPSQGGASFPGGGSGGVCVVFQHALRNTPLLTELQTRVKT